ncbi:MAG: hypothetical protein ACKE5M_04440 [Methylophilaceae bacterium]
MTEENKALEKKSEAGIQQLNLSYDKVQDRLLFRVGLSDDTELALWFTYTFSRELWAALNAEAHLPEAKQFANIEVDDDVEQFQLEVEAAEALEDMDFETEYAPRQELRNEGVMLATDLTLSDDAKHLDITCLEGVVANIKLTPELLLATCNMLQLAAKEAGWELTTGTPSIMIEALEASKVLH